MGKNTSSVFTLSGNFMSSVLLGDDDYIFFSTSTTLYQMGESDVTELIQYTYENQPIRGEVESPAIIKLCPPVIANGITYSGYYNSALKKTVMIGFSKDGHKLYQKELAGHCFWFCGSEQHIYTLYMDQDRRQSQFRILDLELNCLHTIAVPGYIYKIVMTMYQGALYFVTKIGENEKLYRLNANGLLGEMFDLGPRSVLKTNYRIDSDETYIYLQQKVCNRTFSGSNFMLFQLSLDGALAHVHTLHMGSSEEQEICSTGTFELWHNNLIYADGIHSRTGDRIRIWTASLSDFQQTLIEHETPYFCNCSISPVVLSNGTIYSLWADESNKKWISSFDGEGWNIKKAPSAEYLFGCKDKLYVCNINSRKNAIRIQKFKY